LLLVLSFILNYKLRLLQVTKEKREFSTSEEIEKKNLSFLNLKEPTE
jgi:hypothetical protein